MYNNNSQIDHVLGNEMLLRLFNIKTTFIERKITRNDELKELIKLKSDLKGKGKRPVILHKDRIYGTYATIAYYQAAKEIIYQSNKENINFKYIFVPVGAGMTIAGLILGLSHLKYKTTIIGVCTSKNSKFIYNDIIKFVNRGKKYLKIKEFIKENKFLLIDDYVFDNYGSINNTIINSIKTFAVNEGIILDPIYNAKCFSALIESKKYISIKKNDNTLFLNTGGFTELFSYHNLLSQNNV